MAFLTWLPGVLRDAGVDVYVMPGAETRSTRSYGLTPQGLVWHHTATGPNWLDGHVAFLLRDGRRDVDGSVELAGPLAQVGIERDGTWVIVALGRANHNGFGLWRNDSIGLEFYNSGLGEPWPDVQVESGIVGSRAICQYLGWSAARSVLGHKETDSRRKIDPTGLDMDEIRARIDTGEEDDPLGALTDAQQLDMYSRVIELSPFERIRVDRDGVRQPPGTPNTWVVRPPTEWQREATKNTRTLIRQIDLLAAQVDVLRDLIGQLAGGDTVVDYDRIDRIFRDAIGDTRISVEGDD